MNNRMLNYWINRITIKVLGHLIIAGGGWQGEGGEVPGFPAGGSSTVAR